MELDSLPPDVLRGIVKDCIERHIDQGLFTQAQETEFKEQTRLQEFIEQMECLEHHEQEIK